MDGPPENDWCSICRSTFNTPCQANCSHWFCGNCILQVWNHGSTFQPCNCPLCRRQITLLVPSEASSQQRHNAEVSEVLGNVETYNRLFGQRSSGLIQKMQDLPFLLQRLLREMRDPQRSLPLVIRARVYLADESYLTNGYLDTIIDWIPGMKGIRLKQLPSFVRNTDPDDYMYIFAMEASQRASKATGNIFHTFDALEQELVTVFSSMFPNVYTISPQELLLQKIRLSNEHVEQIGYSLWKEDPECIKWLDSKKLNSVVYVNFGSITPLSSQQLLEFGWGLANSNHNFLWIIRPDLVAGESAVLGTAFMEVTKDRGFIASWCQQEEVLNHGSVGWFLTHGGWNSIMESLTAGVPMICWPFFADQVTNCKYICDDWECAMEMDSDVKRDGVEKLVRELIDGEKGKKLKNKALEWKKMAEEACDTGGSSSLNLEKLVSLLHLH